LAYVGTGDGRVVRTPASGPRAPAPRPALAGARIDPAAGPASRSAGALGLRRFGALVRHVARLPYSRNSDRAAWGLVLAERRGTCATKHAVLAAVGRENGLDVALALLVYLMDEANTPGVGPVLSAHGLACLPEAHCVLRTARGLADATLPPAPRLGPPGPVLHLEEIEPDAIASRKPALHRAVLASWLAASGWPFDVEAAWAIREACVGALSAGPGAVAARRAGAPPRGCRTGGGDLLGPALGGGSPVPRGGGDAGTG
jgi:hypothetical protein